MRSKSFEGGGKMRRSRPGLALGIRPAGDPSGWWALIGMLVVLVGFTVASFGFEASKGVDFSGEASGNVVALVPGLILVAFGVIPIVRWLRIDSWSSSSRPTSGWYRDPSGRYETRYWDGRVWCPWIDGSMLSHDTVDEKWPRPRGARRA
jgi:hypothetical protein